MQRRIPPCTEPAWALQTDPSNWPEMRKNLGKPACLSKEDRNRTIGFLPNDFAQVLKIFAVESQRAGRIADHLSRR